jgi:type VI secretion system protein ImpH
MNTTIDQSLTRDAPRFAMLPALAMLEHLALQAGAAPLGQETRPADAAVRLHARAAFGFPASELDEIARPEGGQALMRTRVFGLLGHIGPLPDWITEELAQRSRRGDRAALDFLAIFEQRLMATAFRARARTRHGFAYRAPEASPVGRILHALLGLATSDLRDRMQVPDRALLGFAGLLAGQTRSVGALEQILRSYLKVPVSVIVFVGRWLNLEAPDITRIGARGGNNLLGQSTMLGQRVWDRQSCFGLRIGPLEPEAFESLLPGGARHRALSALTRFFAGPALDCHLELHLRPDCIARPRISAAPGAVRLGWTAFLTTRLAAGTAGITRVAVRETTPDPAQAEEFET